MPCCLRPLDEVGDDQEVAGIFHPLDDGELEGEPLAVVVDGAAGREAVRGDAARQPRLGLRGAAPRPRRARRRRRAVKPRQDRLARPRAERAALRDLDRRGERLGQIGKQRRHLGARLEVVLRRKLAPLGLGDHRALRRCRSARHAPRNPRASRKTARWWRPAGCRAGVGEIDQRRLGLRSSGGPWRCSSI